MSEGKDRSRGANRPRATRASLERLSPMPAQRGRVEIQRSFTPEERANLELGMIPEGMDNHWFAFMEGDWLYVHRSWSGICRYMVRLENDASGASGCHIAEAWANMKERMTLSKDYDARLLRYLIERILGNDWPFPT